MRTAFILAALLAAPVLAAATPASAGEPVKQRITDGGKTYIYTVRQVGRDQVIEGRGYPAGTRFRLRVRGKEVTGTAGGYPVAFTAPTIPASPRAELAMLP